MFSIILECEPKDQIKTFLSKGYLTLEEGDMESARQMFLAYSNWNSSTVYATPFYAELKSKILQNPEDLSLNERNNFFFDKLKQGEIEQRGFIDEQRYKLLISILVSSTYNEEFKQAASKAIIKYTYPGFFF